MGNHFRVDLRMVFPRASFFRLKVTTPFLMMMGGL